MNIDLEHLRRHEFPLTAECAFLNHAASSPLPRRSADVLIRYASRQQQRHLRYRPGAGEHDLAPLRRALAETITAIRPRSRSSRPRRTAWASWPTRWTGGAATTWFWRSASIRA